MPLTLRLDELLVEQGFFAESSQAARACLAGQVRLGESLLSHPGQQLPATSELTVLPSRPYVSRGGEKLAGALAAFKFDPAGLRCLDVGASTGGFTDCLLQAGAAEVTAVDVAYGQFDYRLRNNQKITVRERTNISKVAPEALGAPFQLIVVDVSFSPLARLLPLLERCGEAESNLIALCKPQFELPKTSTEKGVVRQPAAHLQALEAVVQAAKQTAWGIQGLTHSPLRGPKGNIEFFFWATLGANPATIEPNAVVDAAWQAFASQAPEENAG